MQTISLRTLELEVVGRGKFAVANDNSHSDEPPQSSSTVSEECLKTKQNFSNPSVVWTSMFCPRCGRAEQLPETYCRQCGLFLPDLSKPLKREIPPDEHLKANTFLNALTIIVSFTLSILLFAIIPDKHPLIYVTAGLLIAMGAWHIQTLIRTQMLKKQWKRRTSLNESQSAPPEKQPAFKSASTVDLLDQANFSDTIPASVTENTTRHLTEKP